MQAGGDYQLLVIQLISQFDFLTALLEYLDLEGARFCNLFCKSEGTPCLSIAHQITYSMHN